MKTKKWIGRWLLLALFIPGIAFLNYVVDPYGFNKNILIKNFNEVKEDNTVFGIKYKMPHLREGVWTNLMLGTSRIGLLDVKVVDAYLGGKTFTASQPGSAIPIQFDSFFYAVHFNHIKNVIYGLDFMSLNKNMKLNDDYVQYKKEIRSFGPFYTFDIYFNLKTFPKSIHTVLNNMSSKVKQPAFYSENGMRNFSHFQQQFDNGSFDSIYWLNIQLQEYYGTNGIYSNYEYSEKYMEMFKQIINYCNAHDINVYVYIPPLYIDHFNALKEAGLKDEFEHFKRELVKVTDFIDFTGSNSITVDKTKFWDSSHLKKEYTDLIMQKLLKEGTVQQYKDFGEYVNIHNIEAHLKEQNLQYKSLDLKEILDTIY